MCWTAGVAADIWRSGRQPALRSCSAVKLLHSIPECPTVTFEPALHLLHHLQRPSNYLQLTQAQQGMAAAMNSAASLEMNARQVAAPTARHVSSPAFAECLA